MAENTKDQNPGEARLPPEWVEGHYVFPIEGIDVEGRPYRRWQPASLPRDCQ